MSTPFRERVLAVVQSIPRGRVLSYGDVATLCGSPQAARAVGSTLRAHGFAVPWQRVINGTGAISFKGDFERATLQRELLQQEGLEVDAEWRLSAWPAERWSGDGAPDFFDEPIGFDQPPGDWDERP